MPSLGSSGSVGVSGSDGAGCSGSVGFGVGFSGSVGVGFSGSVGVVTVPPPIVLLSGLDGVGASPPPAQAVRSTAASTAAVTPRKIFFFNRIEITPSFVFQSDSLTL